MQDDNEPVYDRCPECAAKIPTDQLDEVSDGDEAVECPSCPWSGYADELTSYTSPEEFEEAAARDERELLGVMGGSPVAMGSWPFTPDECPGFDPGEVLAAYGGRRCRRCGVREPNGTETHPAPRHDIVQLQKHVRERSGPGGGLFELPAYPKDMLEKFAAIQRALPVGTVLDWFGSGPENYTVVTGYGLLPVVPTGLTERHRNPQGAYFILHMSRADGTTRFDGATMSFEEAATYAEKRVGMLSELATAEGEL